MPTEPLQQTQPWVTVVIRSYNRIPSMLELVEACLAQNYGSFDVLVIEQSGDELDKHAKALSRLQQDPRLSIVRRPPLGPAGARNEALLHAKGEIILFMDDDDLPIGNGWIQSHAALYSDPLVIGVSGREVHSLDERCGYQRREARRRCLRYNWLGHPHAYCRFDERVEPVDWLHGGNASVRRSAAKHAGGWDPDFIDHEEHSFAFRLKRSLNKGERLIFDPGPIILRRKNLPGGLSRRQASVRETYERYVDYYLGIIAQYHPWKVALLWWIYLVWIGGVTIRWIWKDSQLHKGFIRKIAESIGVVIKSPWWLCAKLVKRHKRERTRKNTVVV